MITPNPPAFDLWIFGDRLQALKQENPHNRVARHPLPPLDGDVPTIRLAYRADPVLAAMLALAVGLAFADTSIVMLGLPEIYAELGGSVLEVSLVATAYNLVVAIAAFAFLPLARRVRPARLAALGVGVFAVSSLAAGLSDSLTPLLAWRGLQGLGAALLLAASLPLLAELLGPRKGRGVWAAAGTAGAAFGPVAGGVLTEVFDWRAIFLAQAPLAVLALAAVAAPRSRRLRPEPRGPAVGAEALHANLGLVFAFGGLAGALFLGVLMVVTVWGLSPIVGAGVVSALPAAALLVRPLGRHFASSLGAAIGAVLLAVGLLGLALVQSSEPLVATGAMAICGAGFGLLVPPLTRSSVGDSVAGSVATISVGARHVGLVVALLAVAPILATDLESGGEDAAREAAAVVLEADLAIGTKIELARTLSGSLETAPNGEVPDLDAAFAEVGAEKEGTAEVRDDLLSAIERSITPAFSTAFLVSAAFALATLVPIGLGLARSAPGPQRAPPEGNTRRAFAAVSIVAVIVVSSAFVLAEWTSPRGPELAGHDPCEPREYPEDPDGVDATIQRIALDGLEGAACELDTTREELVLAFAPDAPGAADIGFDDETIERATRAGLSRSVSAAEDRGDINGETAAVLRIVSRNAPIEEGLLAYREGGGAVETAERILDRVRGRLDEDLLDLGAEGVELILREDRLERFLP